jgi:hypothetical protein
MSPFFPPSHDPPNRLARFFPVDPVVPTVPSAGDKLLNNSHIVKLSMMRVADDDGVLDTLIGYELHGTIDDDDAATLAALLSQFRQPRGEAGAA